MEEQWPGARIIHKIEISVELRVIPMRADLATIQ